MQGVQKYKRLSMICPAEVTEESSILPVAAYMANLSNGGAAMYALRPLAGHVKLRIFYGDGRNERISETVSARVIWTKKVESFYIAGIEFNGLNSRDHTITLAHLKLFTGSAVSQPI